MLTQSITDTYLTQTESRRMVLAHYCEGLLFRRLGLELGLGLVGSGLGLVELGLRFRPLEQLTFGTLDPQNSRPLEWWTTIKMN